MNSIINRVVSYLEERKKRIEEGNINCIPLPFNRFRSELPGIEQGKYYLISGGAKAGKTQLTAYLFVYNTLLYAYKHKEQLSIKILYYNLEETAEEITLKFISFLLSCLSNIRIAPTDLESTNAEKPISNEILDLIKSERYQKILDFFNEVIEFMPSRNPTGYYKEVKAYAESHGKSIKKKYKYKDELGIEKEGEAFDYYIPNNPNEYVFTIVDHISLIEPERGMNLRECINKWSEYCIIFRNRYKYIPVIVQQQNLETISLESFKNNKIRPTLAGLADSKATGKDCTVMLGITNPFSFEIPQYLGYDITKLKGNFRCMEVVLNRKGQSNGICPLLFDGAVGRFNELPRPDNVSELNVIYTYISKIKNNDVNKTVKSFFSLAKNYKKSNKKLSFKNIFSKFAHLIKKQ